MGLLTWMNRDGQAQAGSVGQEPTQSSGRIEQPGVPFKRGDRVIVYETFHHSRELKHPRYALGVVASVHHNGTRVSYERLGRRPANAAAENVRHATQRELEKYGNRFDAIEEWRRRGRSWER